jgi:hypothetical protein
MYFASRRRAVNDNITSVSSRWHIAFIAVAIMVF